MCLSSSSQNDHFDRFLVHGWCVPQKAILWQERMSLRSDFWHAAALLFRAFGIISNLKRSLPAQFRRGRNAPCAFLPPPAVGLG
jgi:hypothetical protein